MIGCWIYLVLFTSLPADTFIAVFLSLTISTHLVSDNVVCWKRWNIKGVELNLVNQDISIFVYGILCSFYVKIINYHLYKHHFIKMEIAPLKKIILVR